MPTPAEELTDRLRADLKDAMKARDKPAMSALRATISAVSNAEAPTRDLSGPADAGSLGLQDHARLQLTADDLARVLAAELADREDTIARMRAAGQDDAADDLEAELAVVRRYA